MANELDLAELNAGEKDLTGSDFSGADLSNRDLSDCNLEGANLQNTDLRGANLSRTAWQNARTFNLNAQGASFENADLSRTALALADFSGAGFRGASFQHSNVQKCNLDRANLRGANFANCMFQEDSSFSDTVVDETTEFEGARLSRALARNPVFRFYRFERGVLFRKSPDELAAVQSPGSKAPRDIEIERLRRTLDEALEAITRLAEPDEASSTAPHPLQGHNNPPPDVVITADERSELSSALEAAKQELASAEPKAPPFERAASLSRAALKKSLEYVLQKADLAIVKATEEAGKTLGNPARWPALYLVVAGKLQAVIDVLGPFLSRFH